MEAEITRNKEMKRQLQNANDALNAKVKELEKALMRILLLNLRLSFPDKIELELLFNKGTPCIVAEID